VPGKRVHIDDETWHVLELLRRDKMATFQELMDEAVADLLKKHDRPTTLKAALRKSAAHSAEVVQLHPKKRPGNVGAKVLLRARRRCNEPPGQLCCRTLYRSVAL
jgi:hypothetical protein